MNRETPDIHFAGYVMACGYTLDGCRRDGKRCLFRFEASEEVWNELLASWANRTGTVVAFEYVEKIRALKSLVHAV